MKKTITTLAFALSILATSAQGVATTGQCASRPTPDAKLISTTIDGDYQVCKWLVPQGADEDLDNEFSVRYQINIARMISSYDNNSKEVAGLRKFINEVMADKQKQITRINICGYASPDGGLASNERLATARAVDCREFINKEFNLSRYPGKTKGVAQPWSATTEAINESAMPSKSAVLKLVESDQSDSSIEAKLKEMPSSWRYIIKSILPPMRCVEIEMVYTGWKCVETRTLIEPEVVTEVNNYFIIFTKHPSDIYSFANPKAAPLDFRDCRKDGYRRDYDERGKTKFIFKSKRRGEKMKSDSRDRFGRKRRGERERDRERFWFR